MRKNGLSVLKIKSETRCASMSLLLVLIQKHRIPHNRNNAINPVTNEATGVCGIRAATKNATMAMLHHGKYKQEQKLRSMVRIIEIINFIILWLNC
jgi:hypothetical protein